MSQSVLIVDDDPQIRDVLDVALRQAGYRTLAAADGAGGAAKATGQAVDLVILDVGLPEMDGFEVCRKIRATSEVPILFLTARNDEIDRVLGFELGGDDYVVKPFSPRELVNRVKAILKRSEGTKPPARVLRHEDLTLDIPRHRCSLGAKDIDLTATETRILAHLMERPDNVLSRPQLVDAVYGVNIHVSDRTLDSHLRNLRAKLRDAGCSGAIRTVHGVGIGMGSCVPE